MWLFPQNWRDILVKNIVGEFGIIEEVGLLPMGRVLGFSSLMCKDNMKEQMDG